MEPQANTEDDELLNEKQTAEFLSVAVGTLQVWRSTKRYNLPYLKIGRSVRYVKSKARKFRDSRTFAA